MKPRLDLSIGQQLSLGFGAAAAMLILILTVVSVGFARIRDISEIQMGSITERAAATQRVGTAILNETLCAESYLRTRDQATRIAYEQAALHTRAELEQVGQHPDDAEGQHLLLRLAHDAQEFSQAARLMVGSFAGLWTPDSESQLRQKRESLLSTLQTYSALQTERLSRARNEIVRSRNGIRSALFALVGATFALIACTSILTARGVRSPAKALVQAARRLAAGDYGPARTLAASLPGQKTRNELSQLSGTFGRMTDTLRIREDRVSAGARFASAMASSLEVGRLCDLGLGELIMHTGAEVGAIYVLDTACNNLRRVSTHALDGAVETLGLGEGVPGQAARARTPIIMRDIPPDSPFTIRLGIDQAPPRTVAAVPMLLHDRLLGVIVVASLRDLSEDAVSFLVQASAQLAVGLDNALAHVHTRDLAHRLRDGNERLRAQNEELQSQQDELQAQRDKLTSQNEELRQQGEELRRQGEELRRTEEALRCSDRRKDEFLATLSHELRNPLAPVRNSIYLLQKAPPGSEQAAHALAIIDRQVRQLVVLTDDLLDVSRINRGKITLQRSRVDLVELARNSMEDNQALFAANGLQLGLESPPTPVWYFGDPPRLAQVIGCLLHNAAKFTPAGGKVTISVEHDTDNQRARIRVEDTGMGIKSEMLSRVFDPFTQGEGSLARTRGGLGLGLTLTKGLVELHGGTVKAASAGLNAGATFTVELPLPAEIPVEVMPPPALPHPARRVLVIEDNNDAAQSLREVLELMGHVVETAEDGRLGLNRAKQFHPEIVLCDIGLPEMDGYAVARALREDARLRNTFLVAMTGYAQPEDKRRAAEAGFHDHVAKPPSIERLEDLLSRAPVGSS